MASAVVVKFQVDGLDTVQRAFKSVEDAIARGERASTGAAQAGARERVKTTKTEVDQREKEFAKLAKEAERWKREEVRATEKAEKEKTRLVTQGERERAREAVKFQRDQDRFARESVAAYKSFEEQKTRIAEQEAKARHRFLTSLSGASLNGVMTGARAGFNRIGGIAAGITGAALSVGGGFSIADSVRSAGELQRNAALLANSAIGINGVTKADADPARILARAKAASISTGIDPAELVSATRAYVAKASDFKGGMENMEFFGKLAKGTGTDIHQITKTAGLIRSQNKDLDADGMKNMLLSVVMQGKQGAVEMSDLAHAAPKVTRSASSYAGSQTVNQQKLLGLAQIAMRTTASPDASAIALSSLSSDTRNHQAALSAKLGYSVLDKGGKITKSPEELIADVMGATGGNLAQLGQHGGLGFTKPSMKLFEALKPDFDKAQSAYLKSNPGDAKGANAAGRSAALAEMTGVTGQTMDMGSMNEMAERVLKTPAEQFENSLRALKMELGDALIPEFQKLIPVLKEMAPTIVDVMKTAMPAFIELIKTVAEFADAHKGLIRSIAANPIGAILAAEIAKSVAGAALGEVMKKAVTNSLGASSGGLAIASAVMTVALVKMLVDDAGDKDSKNVNGGVENATGAMNAAVDLSHSIQEKSLSAAQIGAARARAAELKKDIAERENNKGGSTAMLAIAGAGAGIRDVATLGRAGAHGQVASARKDRIAQDEASIKSQKEQLESLTRAIAAAEKAFRSMEKTAAHANPDNPSRNATLATPARGGTQ